MPRRNDIEHILIIGSGPIIIGQACEFDYSGAQACKALREEGFRISLVNSNPATIMTDPEFADATYVEPLTVDSVATIIEKEHKASFGSTPTAEATQQCLANGMKRVMTAAVQALGDALAEKNSMEATVAADAIQQDVEETRLKSLICTHLRAKE